MTPFPTFEAAAIRHEAYGGAIVFVMRPATFGTATLVNRLTERFAEVDPVATPVMRQGRAVLLAQTADILVSDDAAKNHPGFAALATFWAWRKSVTDADLLTAAAEVWNWFTNVVPIELLYGEWDKAAGRTYLSAYAAPKELRPHLTEAEKADPN